MLAPLAGLVAGTFHVASGPDHLAAIAPLATSDDRVAWRTGLSWGLGHTAGVLLVGALLVTLREALPLDALSAWSERLVGGALVAVGAWGLWRARIGTAHRHPPSAPSFAMGTLHGLAGSAHLYGVLPSLMFPSRLDAATYLAGFGLGAILAMTLFAALVGRLGTVAGRSGTAARRAVLYLASAATVVIGGVWLLA